MALVTLVSVFFAASLWGKTHYVEIHEERSFHRGDYCNLAIRSNSNKYVLCKTNHNRRGEELVIKREEVSKTEQLGNSVSWALRGTFTYSVHEGTLMNFTENRGDFVGQIQL